MIIVNQTVEEKNAVSGVQKNKKWKIAAIAGIAMLLAALIGNCIYNAPMKRVDRHLKMANKYLEEFQYDQAIVEFDKVIEIDPMCAEAYLGKVIAYVGEGDINKAIATLESALGRINGNTEIKLKLKELYLGEAEKKNADENYEDALKIYDRLLELDLDDELVIRGLCDCLKTYITVLMEAERYDEIRSLAEKYKAVAKYVDFSDILARIREIEEFRALVEGILVRMAAFCSKENYDEVFAMMQSEEYERFLSKIDEIKDDYLLKTEYGRIGIYKVDTEQYGNYMVYYGEYTDDRRQGAGVWLGYYDHNNYMAKGLWKDDFPQGEFAVREWNSSLDESIVYRVLEGSVEKGLWNGEILWKFEMENGVNHTYPVTFKKGKWVALRRDDDGWIVCEKGIEPEAGSLCTEDETREISYGIIGFASK